MGVYARLLWVTNLFRRFDKKNCLVPLSHTELSL